MQWACIICSLICTFTMFKTDIDPLLKLIKYSIYCVIFYAIFVAVALGKNMIQGSINFDQYELFDHDFSSVAGAFALSFLIHPTASPIIKKSAKPENNERHLLLGYCLTAAVYFYVGFFGGMSCGHRVTDIN